MEFIGLVILTLSRGSDEGRAGPHLRRWRLEPRRPRSRFRPEVATLEGRALLSTLTVTNLNDSGEGSLRAEIGNAQEGDQVVFARGLRGTITLTSGVIHVPVGMSIVGPGAKVISVSGGGNSGVFEFDSPFDEPPIVIGVSGLTITGGDAFEVAALNFGATLSFSHCAFLGNEGSALSNIQGILNLQNSSISDNTIGSSDAGLSLTAGLFNGGTANITNCTFSNNVSRGATAVGGAILSSFNSTLNVTSSLFQGNQVQGGYAGAFGGAIHVDEGGVVNISSSSFLGNQSLSSADSSGGAIHTNVASLTITDSLFAGNRAGGSGSAAGGALSLAGTTIVSDTVFSSNQALGTEGSGFDQGGAISNLGTSANLTLTSDLFIGNRAMTGVTPGFAGFAAGGALANQFGATASIDRTRFVGNRALGADASGEGNQGAFALGGAIQNIFNSTLTLTNSDFLDNQALAGDGTGGATGGTARGGAIDNESSSALEISNTTIMLSRARGGSNGGGGFGGGIYTDQSLVSIVDSLILLNSATGGSGGGQGVGGGLYINSGTVSLRKTKVLGNHASTSHNNIFGSYTL